MGDDDIGIPDEKRPVEDGLGGPAPGPHKEPAAHDAPPEHRENPWLQPSGMVALVVAEEQLLSASIARAATAAKLAEEQIKLSFSLAQDVAHETVAFAAVESALRTAEAFYSALSGGLAIGAGAIAFSSKILDAHDPRKIARPTEGSESPPSDRAPAMVWRTYAAQSFFDLASRIQGVAPSLPAVQSIARTLSSAAPIFSRSAASPAAPTRSKATIPPVQTLRSLAHATRTAALPLMAEGFGTQLSAAFASAAGMFERAAHPATADKTASEKLAQEIKSEWDALHALLMELSKGQFEAVKSRQSKQGAIDAFRGHSAESVANAPNKDLAGSLRAVDALASQLMEYNAEPTPAPVRMAQKAAGALAEVVGALENAGAMSFGEPESAADPKAKLSARPEPGFRRAISLGATKALARSAAFGRALAGSAGRAGQEVMAGVQNLMLAGSNLLTLPPASTGLAFAGAGSPPAGGLANPPFGPIRAGTGHGGVSSFIGGSSSRGVLDGGSPGISGSPPSHAGQPGLESGLPGLDFNFPKSGKAPPVWADKGPDLPPLKPEIQDLEGGFGPTHGSEGPSHPGGPPSAPAGVSLLGSPPPAPPTPPRPSLLTIGLPSPALPPEKVPHSIVPFTPSIGLPQSPPTPGQSPPPSPGQLGLDRPPAGAPNDGHPSDGHPNDGPPPFGDLPPLGVPPPPASPSFSPAPSKLDPLNLKLPPSGGAPQAPPSLGSAPPSGNALDVDLPHLPFAPAGPPPAAGPIDGVIPHPWAPPHSPPNPKPPSVTPPDPESNPTGLRDTLVQSGGPGIVPDTSMRRRLEPHLGFDPGIARLHTGPESAEAAQELQAQAFTIGRDVFFGKGKYSPETTEGLSLIGHEVTHVGQQTGAQGDRMQRFSERGGDEMEHQARQVAQRVFNHHADALQVEEYVCEFVSGSGKFGSDENQRLERLATEAFEAAEKSLANWNGDLGTVEVNLTIAPAEMSDSMIVQRWRDAIVSAVKSASSTSPSPSSPNAAIQKFDSYEHVELGESTPGGKDRKFKIKEQRDKEAALTAEQRHAEYAAILAHTAPPAKILDEKDDTGKKLYVENRAQFLKKGLDYGEVIALSGDHFGSFDELDKADLSLVTRLIPLIHSRKAGNFDFLKANPNYLKLALLNEAHFSDRSNPVNNLTTYRKMHLAAMMEPNPSRALMMNAAADHFLTDAFSSGHMRVPRKSLDTAGKALTVASAAGALSPAWALMEIVVGLTAGAISAKNNKAGLFASLRSGLLESPHIAGGLMAMLLHDHDNAHGVKVKNALGQTWTAYGDDHLNYDKADSADVKKDKIFNREIAIKAVRASQQEVRDMMTSSGQHKAEPPKPPYAAEQFIPMPLQGYMAELKSDVKSGANVAVRWVYDTGASLANQLGSLLDQARSAASSATDKTLTGAIHLLERLKKAAVAAESTVRDVIWGGKDAQEYVLKHRDSLQSLPFERKRELLARLVRRLVTAKDREAVAVLYRASTEEERSYLSMEFGAQFSESPYTVRSTLTLVPAVTAAQVAELERKSVFDPIVELPTQSDFRERTDYGWFGVGRPEGLEIADQLLAALQALDTVPLPGGTALQGQALLLVTRLADVLTAFLDQVGSTASQEQRRAAVGLLVKLRAWKLVLQKHVTAGAFGRGLGAMNRDTLLAVTRAADYADTFVGTADSSFQSVGRVIDKALFRPYTAMEGSFTLKFPIDIAFVGLSLKVVASRDDDVKVGLRLGAMEGVGEEVADLKGSFKTFQGMYSETKAKTGVQAMHLFSYGLYQSMRESYLIPAFVPAYMWGGSRGTVNEAAQRADMWSANTEKTMFEPLAKRLASAKTAAERKAAENAIANTYAEIGSSVDAKGVMSAKAGGRKVGSELSFERQDGTRFDLHSIEAAEGGTVGARFIHRGLSDTAISLGRVTEQITSALVVAVDPFEFTYKRSVLGEATKPGRDEAIDRYTVGIVGSASGQMKWKEIAEYAGKFSQSIPKIVEWASKFEGRSLPERTIATLSMAATKTAKGLGGGLSYLFQTMGKGLDPLSGGPKLVIQSESVTSGPNNSGTASLMVEEDPKIESRIVDAELKYDLTALGVKWENGNREIIP